jgi:excisionase family DNA binding protein
VYASLQDFFLNGLDTKRGLNFNILDTFEEVDGRMYLNVQRAALRLGVAPHTVRRWTASGLLPCTRTPGGHRRIRQEDVDALAQQIGGGGHLEARRARERELATLLETSLALVGQLELPDLLREIARQLTRLMECDFCGISAYDATSQSVRMLADFDHSGRRLPDEEDYLLSRYPLTRRVLEEQTPAVVNASDPAADPHELRALVREGDKSLLMVPLVFRGRSIGLVELMDHRRERRYSAQELRICTAVAGQAAAALHNAQLFADAGAAAGEAERMRARLDDLAAAVTGLRAATDPAGVLKACAAAACRLLGASTCVAVAGGLSAGHVGDAGAWTQTGRAGDEAGAPDVVTGAEILRVSAGSGPATTLTASLPRAAERGETELLRVLAAAASAVMTRSG